MHGWNDYQPEAIFAGVPEALWRAAAVHQITEEGMVRLPYRALLVRSGEQIVLIDTGLGDLAGPDGTAGKLRGSLEAEGLQPADVNTVVISHCHPDHIGGLIRVGGSEPSPAYPNARVVMSKTEWEFWTSDASSSMMERMRNVAGMVLPVLSKASAVDLIDGSSQILPGLSAVPAPGHTPGHMAIRVDSDGDRAIYLADTVLHTAQIENPDWTSAIDADAELTVSSRRRLLEMAGSEGLLALAFHLGSPGRIVPAGDGYRFTPEG
jgi:glyoxylase-like metal-dependent hydrolase (beta-lactamase superfamily II)